MCLALSTLYFSDDARILTIAGGAIAHHPGGRRIDTKSSWRDLARTGRGLLPAAAASLRSNRRISRQPRTAQVPGRLRRPAIVGTDRSETARRKQNRGEERRSDKTRRGDGGR